MFSFGAAGSDPGQTMLPDEPEPEIGLCSGNQVLPLVQIQLVIAMEHAWRSRALFRILFLSAIVCLILILPGSAVEYTRADPIGGPRGENPAAGLMAGPGILLTSVPACGFLAGETVRATGDSLSSPGDMAGSVLRFFLNPFLQFFSSGPEPVVGLWEISSTKFQMEFDRNGTAVLRYPDSGNFATGHWERAGENRYRIWSGPGNRTILVFNPVSDTLHSEDFTVLLVRGGDQK